MKAWIRDLYIELTSSKIKKKMSFGRQTNSNLTDFSIRVNCHKYMSSLKDEAIVEIDNLTYSEIVQIIQGEFYNIDIYCGYKSSGANKIFSGGVFYISNRLNSDRTQTTILICTSKMVARYGQQRLNLTLNSGINMYSAINFVCRRAGMPNAHISTQFKKQFLDEITNVDTTVSQWLDKLCNDNDTYIQNADSILDQTFSIFDAAKSNNRIIKLTADNILLTSGYPRLTRTGLTLTLLPTFNFMCGDTIQLPNEIIDISVDNRNDVAYNPGAQLNDKGQYMIYEMEYQLENRGQQFSLRLKCKNRARITSYRRC